MSERTTRTARSVDAAQLANAVSSTVIAAQVIGHLAGLLGKATWARYRQSADSLLLSHNLLPACDVAAMTTSPGLESRNDLRLAETEAVKLACLSDLAAKPYVVEPIAIERHIRSFQAAGTPADTKRESAALTSAVQASHDKVFISSLAAACREAAREIGFATVELTEHSEGRTHIVGTHPSGRALVTEIRSMPGQAPQLASEVVGISDSSCSTILDAFDEALAKRGVRLSGHNRRFTAGIPELEVARAFVRRKVSRPRPRQPQTSPANKKRPGPAGDRKPQTLRQS